MLSPSEQWHCLQHWLCPELLLPAWGSPLLPTHRAVSLGFSSLLPAWSLWGRALEHRDVPAPCVAPGLAQLCCFSFVLYNEINFYSPSVHSPCLCAVLGPAGVPTAGRSPEGGGCPPIWAKLLGFGVQAEAWFLDEALALLSSTQHCATSLPAPVSQWQLFPRPFLSLQAPSQALDTRNTVSVQERDFPCTSPGSYGGPRDG